MNISPNIHSKVYQQPLPQKNLSATQGVKFAGPADTFQKRLERDELAFSSDLKTVLDFYESLPFKKVFQSKEDRERIERLLIQKDHAEFSRRALEETAAGGHYLNELLQEQWDELDIPEEDRKIIYQNTLKDEGLPSMPEASMGEVGQRLGQYYGHEHDEAIQKNYGVGELSDQAKEDAQKILHSGIGLLATAIKFVSTNPNMAQIVNRNQIRTNPSPENLHNALQEWHSLFGNDITSTSPRFSGRTKKYGASRNNQLETFGTLMLSIYFASAFNALPYAGYKFNKQFHRGFVHNALASAYKLNVNEPSIKEDLKKLQNFTEATIEAEKITLWATQGIADASTLGAASLTSLNSLIGITVGAIGEAIILGVMDTKLSNYSKKFYDALEDFPRIKTSTTSNKDKLLTKSEVATELKKKDSIAYSNYIKFQDSDMDASLLTKLYDEPRYWPKKTTSGLLNSLFSDDKEENKVWAKLFTTKNEIDGKDEAKPLVRHIIHANKALNPDFQITSPYDISKFPWLKWMSGLPKRFLTKDESSA